MKNKNTGVQHVTGVLHTPGGALVSKLFRYTLQYCPWFSVWLSAWFICFLL